jgi:ketosteroid isomerase-like protein
VSQQNLELVRKWLASFESDPDAFRNTLHPEIEWFPFEENHSPSRGIGAAMRIRSQWLDPWDEMRADLEELHDEGDSVLASIHVAGRGKTSGAEVDVRLYLHFKIRGGKVVYLFEHTDRRAALEAMGLREHRAHADS